MKLLIVCLIVASVVAFTIVDTQAARVIDLNNQILGEWVPFTNGLCFYMDTLMKATCVYEPGSAPPPYVGYIEYWGDVYFTSSNCTGSPYLGPETDYWWAPSFMYFWTHTIYITGDPAAPPGTVTLKSYNDGSGCSTMPNETCTNCIKGKFMLNPVITFAQPIAFPVHLVPGY